MSNERVELNVRMLRDVDGRSMLLYIIRFRLAHLKISNWEAMSEAIRHFFSQDLSFYRNVAAVIGALWLSRALFAHIRLKFSNFCAFILPKLGIYKVDVTAYGSWASKCVPGSRLLF